MAGRKDPLISPRFTVKFGSKLTGAFREVTVVSAETEPAEYKFTDDQGNRIPQRAGWQRSRPWRPTPGLLCSTGTHEIRAHYSEAWHDK